MIKDTAEKGYASSAAKKMKRILSTLTLTQSERNNYYVAERMRVYITFPSLLDILQPPSSPLSLLFHILKLIIRNYKMLNYDYCILHIALCAYGGKWSFSLDN